MSRMYAVSTCLPNSPELNTYLSNYLPFYCGIQREVFQALKHGVLDNTKRSAYVSDVMARHKVLKRTVNSILFDMQGRIKAYKELKNTELQELSNKLDAVDAKIEAEKKTVDEMKPSAAKNALSEEDLQKYRTAKKNLYYLKNKKNRLTQKQAVLAKQIEEGYVSICFGTKDFFSKQHRLEENGFRSHTGWHNAFAKKRDSGIFFLGSGDEKCGNQILQLRYDESNKEFKMFLLKDKEYRTEAGRSNAVIVVDHIAFPYMQTELQAAIQNKQPVTYRISKKHNRWYLTAMFSVEVPLQTFNVNGVYGVDYNNGFLEVVETNDSGNMIFADHIPLNFHGTGDKAETELKEKLSKFVRLARDHQKDIIIENLDFTKKKSKTLPGKRKQGKQYNKMIHAFDYSRYTFWMENLCSKYGVGLKKVNPAYTSKIGKEKYAGLRKLTVHRAAAFVIARRGQGFKK